MVLWRRINCGHPGSLKVLDGEYAGCKVILTMFSRGDRSTLPVKVVNIVVFLSFLAISLFPAPTEVFAALSARSNLLDIGDSEGPVVCATGGPGCGDPPPPTTLPDCKAGTLPGQAGVSCTGAGTYEIPIEVPPGSADMQPALSLTYNSQAGNGLLGMGWSINGLSAITRCAANMALDGYKGGINYDENDKFCLDGQRLVPIPNLALPPGEVEYRTEPDTFTRVKSYGTTATGADYFTAEAKSGLITEYGNTPDSKIEAVVEGVGPTTGVVRVWAANELLDRVGSYIEYEYNEDTTASSTGEYSPKEIRYTGNASITPATVPYNFVKFEYQPRNQNDVAPFYQGGSVVRVTKALSAIKTCLSTSCTIGTNGTLVQQYNLRYQQNLATKRYQLHTVQKCDSSGTTNCLPETVMSWSDDGVTNLAGNETSGSGGTREWNSANFADSKSSFQKSDAPIYYDAFVTAVKGIANNPDAGSAVLSSVLLGFQLFSFYSSLYYINPIAVALYIAKQFIDYIPRLFTDRYWIPKGKLGDVDHDGRIDIVGFAKQGDSKNFSEYVWLSKKLPSGGNQFIKQGNWKTNELRQDTDIFKEETTETDEAKLADFNDDGLMDVLSFEEKNNAEDVSVYVYESNGTSAFVYNGQKVDDVSASPKKAIGHTSIGDFNGDGKPDFAKFTEKDGVYGHIYLNQGGAFVEQPTWGLCEPFEIACERADNPLGGILMGDVNGDEKTDIIVLSEADNGFSQDETHAKIWLTNKEGTNWAPDPATFDFDYDFYGDDPDIGSNVVQPGDFNGDGKMDLAVFRPHSGGSGAKIDTNNSGGIDNDDFAVISTVFRVYLSTGRTFTFQDSFNRDLFSPLSDTTGGNAAFATDNQKFAPGYYVEGSKITFLPRLSDFNGDGKTDAMIFDANDYNYAHLWLSDGTKLRHDPTLGNSVNDSNYGIVWGSEFGKVDQVMVGDFDGDGRADALSFARPDYPASSTVQQYDGQLNVTLSSSYPFPDLMTGVKDGFGKEDEFDYKPLTDDDVYNGHTPFAGVDEEVFDFRGPLYVVSEYRTSDGIGGMYKQKYTYWGAKSHRSYGFLGFSQIVIKDLQTLTFEIVEYEQKYPLICRIKARTVFPITSPATNALLSAAQQSDSLSEHTMTWGVINGTGPGGMPHNVRLDSETDIQYELGVAHAQLSNTRISYSYDAYNNVLLRRTDWPGQIPTITAEDITSTYDNITTPTTWILGLPKSTKVERFEPVGVPARVTNRQFNQTNGLLTASTKLLQGGKTTTSSYLYDAFGNVRQVTVSGSDIAPRTTAITYETKGRFPTSVQNPLNQTTNLVFEPKFGQVSTSTDPNNLSTGWQYDSFGREILEKRPDATTSQTNYCVASEESYKPSLAPAVGWIQTKTSGLPDQTFYYDPLGREVRTAAIGFDGTRTYNDSLYNSELRLGKVSQPYYSLPGLSSWIEFTYDIRGRVTKQVAPNGAQTTFTYSANATLLPNPFPELTTPPRLLWHQITEENDLGQETDYIVNRVNQVNRVDHRDAQNNLLSSVTYSDDAYGNQVAVADHNGNITRRTYEDDRMVSLSDPDTATSTYTYDVLGNLKSVTDSKVKNTVTLNYDRLDRLASRAESEGTSTWTYDTGPRGIGRLRQTIGPGGVGDRFVEIYVYDDFGRPFRTATTIPGDPALFITERTYNTAGRVATLKYPGPDNFTVRNGYQYGYLSEVRNDSTGALFWQANSLNAAGQLTGQTQGNTTPGNNTIGSTFTYDKMHNITDIKHGDSIGSAEYANPVKHLTYVYNSLNNLTEQRNLIRSAIPSVKKDYIDQFSYDPLNRLTEKFSAVLDYIGPGTANRDDLLYTYNAIGNITNKSDLNASTTPNYFYPVAGSPGPHAVFGIDDDQKGYAFTYDINGNMLTGQDFQNGQSRSMSWYSYNKPSQISEGGKSLALTYDTYRDKIAQVYTAGIYTKETEYIGSIYEKVTKQKGSIPPGPIEHKYYIYGSGSHPVAMFTTSTLGTSNMRYFLYDNLGSLNLITDETAGVVEDLSYDPHGARRNADWTVATSTVHSLTAHGFTNHEHLDEFGLIDMKGRMYDPKIGRFVSADPYITDPFLTESLNRYSYVHNSPTNFVDPTGFQCGCWGPLASQLFPALLGTAGIIGAGSLLLSPTGRPAWTPPAAADATNYVTKPITDPYLRPAKPKMIPGPDQRKFYFEPGLAQKRGYSPDSPFIKKIEENNKTISELRSLDEKGKLSQAGQRHLMRLQGYSWYERNFGPGGNFWSLLPNFTASGGVVRPLPLRPQQPTYNFNAPIGPMKPASAPR